MSSPTSANYVDARSHVPLSPTSSKYVSAQSQLPGNKSAEFTYENAYSAPPENIASSRDALTGAKLYENVKQRLLPVTPRTSRKYATNTNVPQQYTTQRNKPPGVGVGGKKRKTRSRRAFHVCSCCGRHY